MVAVAKMTDIYKIFSLRTFLFDVINSALPIPVFETQLIWPRKCGPLRTEQVCRAGSLRP